MTLRLHLLCLILSGLVFSLSSSVVAQESPWIQLLKEADQGPKSLGELIAIPERKADFDSPEDFVAVANWLKSIDFAELPERPHQIGNIVAVLNLLNSLTLTPPAPNFDSKIQPALEQKLNQMLEFPADKFNPLEGLAFSALRFILITQSSQSSAILLKAAENPIWQHSSYWSHIYMAIPDTSFAVQTLKTRILEGEKLGLVAVSLVEFENNLALEDATQSHFLSRSGGNIILREWLKADFDLEPQQYDAAQQAAISLAFVQCPDWEELIELAQNHPDLNVVLEAAWAGSRRSHAASIDRLVELAKDVRYSLTAVSYLRELSLESRIPMESEEPSFLARAELANWLSYPTEKGRPPDQMKVIDNRQLKWPLEEMPVNVYLIEYTYKAQEATKDDEVDIGFVGPMTFCHFDMKMIERSKEDIYGIHVYRELSDYDLIEDVNLEEQPGAFDYLLKMWKGEPLEDATLLSVARLEPSVEYPRRLLGLARAKKGNTEGYVVLDGPRSKWYPRKTVIADTPENALLMIHLGRQLLGL